jgi:DNA-binding transcriptional ArsR family regulator
MPQRSPLASVFHALADATRLAVVERLSVGPASASELARPFDMALPSFMQHLGVLERAGVVISHKTGRTRVYQLSPAALRTASDWLSTFRNHWDRRLVQLDHMLTTPSISTASITTPSISTASITTPSITTTQEPS